MLNLPPDMTVAQINQMLEEQRKAKARAKYERNREAHLACLRKYNEAHREELRQRQREYHEAHRDEINARKREARARAKILRGLNTPGDQNLQAENNILVT